MTNAAKNTTPGVDRAALLAVIEPVARAHGAEVVEVELKTELGGWILRVSVEKLGSADSSATVKDAAVDLAMCANVSRDLSPALDVADLVPHRYTLEVSSPGVERPLKAPRDFARFSGQKAKVRVIKPINGQKVLRGVIGFNDGVITINDGRAHEVPFADIETAHLVFEFGPQPKPGGKPPHPNKKK